MSAQTPSVISRCLRATTFPERTRLRNPSPSSTKTLHHSTLLYSTQTNSTKTTQKLVSILLFCISFIFFYFSDFSFYIYPFLSLFSYFSFLHISCCQYFYVFFCFCERGSGGVWPAGGAWARQRGVWPANCVYVVCSGKAEAVQGRCPCTAQLCCSHQPARKTAFCLLFLTAAGKLVCMVGCALF